MNLFTVLEHLDSQSSCSSRDTLYAPFDYLVNFIDPTIRCIREICVARLVEAQPERLYMLGHCLGRCQKGRGRTHHYDNLSLWPFAVNSLDDLGQSINVGFCGNVVGLVVVVGADIDDDQVCSWAFAKVPRLGLVCMISPVRRCASWITTVESTTYRRASPRHGSLCQKYRTTGELAPWDCPNSLGLPHRCQDKQSQSTRCCPGRRRDHFQPLVSTNLA